MPCQEPETPPYGAGPGAIIEPVWHGSHETVGGHTVLHGAIGGHAPYCAPREHQSQQRQPTAPAVIINTAVRISNFFMIRISRQNVLASERSTGHVNSTTRSVMCKRNCVFFLKLLSCFFATRRPGWGYNCGSSPTGSRQHRMVDCHERRISTTNFGRHVPYGRHDGDNPDRRPAGPSGLLDR